MEVQINFVAAIAAAVLGFVIGAVWYSPLLFSRVWAREAGMDDGKMRGGNIAMIFGLAFVGILIAALNLAAFIGPKASLGFGTFAGFATGLGWVAMALGVLYLFERRSMKLWLVNSGYMVLMFTAMGALIGAWR